MHSAISMERRRTVETHPPFNVVNMPGGVMCEFANLGRCALLIEFVIGANQRLAIQEVHGGTSRYLVGRRPSRQPAPAHLGILCNTGHARVSL